MACHEIMIGTPAIKNLIREDKAAQMYSIIQTSSAVGMKTMEQSAKALLANNLVESEEVNKILELNNLTSAQPF